MRAPSIQGLAALVPKTAFLETDGRTEEVPAASVAVGALILVRPGDRIPADGVIVAGKGCDRRGTGHGRKHTRRKRVGDAVFAGTINGDAALRIRVTAAAADNTIARVVRLVEEAQESKAPTERFIDRFSRFYTPVSWRRRARGDHTAAISGRVVGRMDLQGSGAFADRLSVRARDFDAGGNCRALSAGARRGLLLKGGAVLENIGKITAAAFDKTGTLTEGKPKVTDVIGFGRGETDVCALRPLSKPDPATRSPLPSCARKG